MATDKNGFLLAVMVMVAQVHDGKAALLLMRVLKDLLCGIRTIIANGGYRGETAAQAKKQFGYLLQVVMCSDGNGFVGQQQRQYFNSNMVRLKAPPAIKPD